MKNAKHAENLKSLTKKALKEGKGAETAQMDPIRALVRGILSYDVGDARADEALATIDREFCELNEVRVATELELQDMLGHRYPDIERRIVRMIAILNAIFEKEHTLNLERVKTLPKKEVRQFLRELPEVTPYVEAYTLLHGFESSAVPVDDELVALVVEHEGAAEDATAAEVQKAIENLLKAEEHGEFHAGARRIVAEKRKRK